MQYVFHLPKEYSFEKVGIKGTNFDTKNLTDKAKFAIIETEKRNFIIKSRELRTIASPKESKLPTGQAGELQSRYFSWNCL